jgi:flagellin-like protein
MKGITPVVATIMLLLITIAMVGFAYIWFNNIATTVTVGLQNSTQNEIIRERQLINIENPKNGSIVIRNIGGYSISKSDLNVYVNNTLKTCGWEKDAVSPGDTITSYCNCTAGVDIKVTAPGNFDFDICTI